MVSSELCLGRGATDPSRGIGMGKGDVEVRGEARVTGWREFINPCSRPLTQLGVGGPSAGEDAHEGHPCS